MTEAKFTKGPWFIRATSRSGLEYEIKHSGGEIGWVNDNPSVDGSHQANARLIAAAPDMYEALESLIYALENAPPLDMMKEIVLAGDKARSALAKARGEQ